MLYLFRPLFDLHLINVKNDLFLGPAANIINLNHYPHNVETAVLLVYCKISKLFLRFKPQY